jgi:hypothetical protein
MTLANEAQKQIEEYLETLRARLRGVSERDASEFLKELRCHIQEKTSAVGETTRPAVQEVLAALGNPDELAAEYTTNALLDRTEGGSSPFRVLPVLFRWATFSVPGLFVMLGAIGGYLFGGILFACAILKPFHPHTAGLWAFHDETGDLTLSLRLGWGNPPPGAHELLGWWIVPIGLLAALGLVLTTSRLALWIAQRLRRPNVF